MIVIGAGISGLLAATVLRDECTSVMERQPGLPQNHHAILRFRSPNIEHVTGIPLKPVKIMKTAHPFKNPVTDMIHYSIKCTGKAEIRSIHTASGNIETRYAPPKDFQYQLAQKANGGRSKNSIISYNCDSVELSELIWDQKFSMEPEPIISTIPMPILMDILAWRPKPKFESFGGCVIRHKMNSNLYASVYFPDPTLPFSRVSIEGDELVIECPDPATGIQFRNMLKDEKKLLDFTVKAHSYMGTNGIAYYDTPPIAAYQKRLKILPIDEQVRREFISWATVKHNVYSLGRYAAWRPGLVTDDLIRDIQVIRSLIRSDSYEQRMRGLD